MPAFMSSESFLKGQEYYSLLTAEYNETQIITRSPILAKPSEIYIYRNSENNQDWRADRYRWENYGDKMLPTSGPVMRAMYFKSFVVGSKFVKRAYTLLKNGERDDNASTVIIHYVGSLDGVEDTPHGNCKVTDPKNIIPFTTTAKSQLAIQKSDIQRRPKEANRKHLANAADEPPTLQPVMAPKNYKQVANTIARERKRNLLSNDDIYGLYLLNEEIPDFVHLMQLIPNFAVVLFRENMINLFLSVHHLPEVVLHYDTTFNIGDFYLSILVYKHPIFEHGRTIPLAYLMHHKKVYDVHRLFFETLKQHLTVKTFDLKIVTDREAAIVKAIKTVLPECRLFFCWNHIIRDIEYWLKSKKNSDIGNIMVYKNNVWDLLDSNSKSAFQNKYDEMVLMWSEKFKQYFDKNLLEDIMSSAKWVLNDPSVDIYEERTGITNNPSESFNAVLKRIFQTEVQAQVCAASIYQLSLYYEREICRGMCKLGEYKLKGKYAGEFFMKPEDMVYPETVIDLKRMPYCFQNKDDNVKHEAKEEKVCSTFSLAKMLVLEDKVKHIAQDGLFLVGDEKHVVKLNPSCSCKLKKKCHHIEAVKISCNFINVKQDQVKLRKLMRKTRGVRFGIKNVPKNVTIVEASDDSDLLKISPASYDKRDFKLIPTSVTADKVVKRRLLLTAENDESITPPRIFSTPKVGHKHSTERNDSFEFADDVKKNNDQLSINKPYKVYNIFGRTICRTHLDSLDRQYEKGTDVKDLYIYGQTVCVYLTITSREVDRTVNFFVCEDMFMSNFLETPSPMNETLLQVGLEEFLSYKVPEYDIVLMPFTKNDHTILIVVLTSTKTLLYLDSYRNVNKHNIILALNYFRMYEDFHNRPFDYKQYSVYAPQVPQQFNGYDCGAFACMFGEAIIKSNIDACNYVPKNSLIEYRRHIKNTILRYINNQLEAPGPETHDYDYIKFRQYHLEFKTDVYSDMDVIRETPD